MGILLQILINDHFNVDIHVIVTNVNILSSNYTKNEHRLMFFFFKLSLFIYSLLLLLFCIQSHYYFNQYDMLLITPF